MAPSRDEIQRAVADVIAAVRGDGDEALAGFARRWDRCELRPGDLRVPAAAIAVNNTPSSFLWWQPSAKPLMKSDASR